MNNDLYYSTAVDVQQTIVGRFQYLSWGEFTGSVNVSAESGQAWEILLDRGQIVWCIDRQQPNRFWQRHLRSQLGYPHTGIELLFEAARHIHTPNFRGRDRDYWQYQGAIALMMLAEITRSNLRDILTIGARETLFDLFQYSQIDRLEFRSQAETLADRPPLSIDTKTVLAEAEIMWQDWHEQKLGNISPNKAPRIEHPVQLEHETTPITYKYLIEMFSGQQTLRELAIETDRDLLLLTRSIARHIQTDIIELIDLPDLPVSQQESGSGGRGSEMGLLSPHVR
jgi:two-component system, chemotaxis family, response regulator PixG